MSEAIFRVRVGPAGYEAHLADCTSYGSALALCGDHQDARRTVTAIVSGKGAIGGVVFNKKAKKPSKKFGNLADDGLTKA